MEAARIAIPSRSTRAWLAAALVAGVVLLATVVITLGPTVVRIWEEPLPEFWPAPRFQLTDQQGRSFGSDDLAGRAALVNARLGQGHVILFGMRPQYRGQSYQTFKLFFNALVYQ